jgi:hypothetical protein
MSLSSTVRRGAFVLASRFASSRSIFSVTAASITAARSPPGASPSIRICSRSSFCFSEAVPVNWNL